MIEFITGTNVVIKITINYNQGDNNFIDKIFTVISVKDYNAQKVLNILFLQIK